MSAPGEPTGPDRALRRQLLWLAVAALVWRWLLAMRTPVPAEDGASYLWMAQRFAAGEFLEPLTEVFPPLLGLLCAGPIALGLDPTLSGQLVCSVCAALAVFPVAFVAERLHPGAGAPAAALLATGSLLARNAAEVMSESPFLLTAALALHGALRGRFVSGGVCAALAFALRPEGAALPLALWAMDPRRGWRALIPVVAMALLLGWWRLAAGAGFDPMPKLAFHGTRDELPDRGDLPGNLLLAPVALVEAYGPAIVLVLLAPFSWRGADGRSRAARPLWAWLALDLVAVVTFVVRRRFFLGAAASVLPLCAAGLQRLPGRWRELTLAVLCALGMFDGWFSVMAADRIAERIVGQHLAQRIGPGEAVAGDMPRVIWFAGSRPPLPRHYSTEELARMARAPAVRFVAIGSRREDADALQQALAAEFAAYALPGSIAELAQQRGIAVLVRR